MPTNQNAGVGTQKHAVTVTFDPSAGYWTMDTGQGPVNPPNYPGLVVPYNHKGEITFQIKNTPGVKFGNPAFAQKTGKPDPGDFGAQFTHEVKADGKILVVHDANTSLNGVRQNKDYHYQLNFTNEVPLDPIITNMGCCRAVSDEPNYAVYALGAAALLALYFLVVRPWMVRRSAQTRPPTNQGPMDR